MRRLVGIVAVVGIAFGVFVGRASAPRRHAAAAAVTIDEVCPPLYSGEWVGTWTSNDFADTGGTVDGTITMNDDGSFSGPFTVQNSDLAAGTMAGQVTCDTFTSTFTTDNAVVTETGTIAPDGRMLTADYTYDAAPDHGTFAITIISSPNSMAIGDTTTFENSGGALLAATRSTPATRTIAVPVTLEQSATVPVSLTYTLSDGSATRGNDYWDPLDGKGRDRVHKVVFAAGQTQKNISVKVMANVVRPDDRSFFVNITPATGGYLAFAATGTVTIKANH